MDRLPLIVLLAATSWSCKDKTADKPPPSSSRVNSVKAAPTKAIDLDAFCDVRPKGDKAFAFPELAGPAPALTPKWHWVNVWATWCAPCVEELPMLVAWQKELSTFDLVFVSGDESDEALTNFKKAHPATPASLRIADPEKLGPWFVSLGLDSGATLPVHVFVSPKGQIDCIRSGAISRNDRAAILSLVAQ